MSNLKNVIFVVGPTAVGKSAFAQAEALRLNSEIVNGDSLQFYSDLNIGTAKPSDKDMQEVRHSLFNTHSLGQAMTAGEYRRMAMSHFENSNLKNHFVVGGSGFYLQALEKGMFDIGEIPQAIKDKVDQIKHAGLLPEELKKTDLKSAEKIPEQDEYRQGRALEVSLAMGKPFSQLQEEFKANKFPYPLLKIGFKMDRDRLKVRVEQRAKAMLEMGLFEEVKGLLEKDVPLESWAPLNSVGYKETLLAIDEQWSEADWLFEVTKNTMRLAKRQMTWFKRDQDVHWFDVSEADAFGRARLLVDSFLS